MLKERESYSREGVRQVPSSASAVPLATTNLGRRSLTIYNASTAILYVKFGETPSTTSYKLQMPADSFYEMPTDQVYTGVVTGIWASANGNAYVSEGDV